MLSFIKHVAIGLSVLMSSQVFAAGGKFTVGSKDIKEGGKIADEFVFNSFGCSGKNVSPELNWSNPPAGTKSFAVTVFDPDAPTGSGFWHYVAYDIPATSKNLAKGAAANPTGFKNAISDFGTALYGGPCPPPGKPHRYVFTVHALKVEKLGVPDNATNAIVRFTLEGQTIAKAKLTAQYGR